MTHLELSLGPHGKTRQVFQTGFRTALPVPLFSRHPTGITQFLSLSDHSHASTRFKLMWYFQSIMALCSCDMPVCVIVVIQMTLGMCPLLFMHRGTTKAEVSLKSLWLISISVWVDNGLFFFKIKLRILCCIYYDVESLCSSGWKHSSVLLLKNLNAFHLHHDLLRLLYDKILKILFMPQLCQLKHCC